MLSISNPLKGAGRGNYYLDLAQEDYYANRAERPGRWRGEGCTALRLTGTVEREAFQHLLAGLSPDGRRPLVQNAQDPERQSAWDLTFSAPKSVSVYWGLSGEQVREQVELAHDRAVEVALAYVEQTAGVTRRGKEGRLKEKSALTFATFQHGTSRALDPQLHTHCVLINLSIRRDGTTGSLQSRDFFRKKLKAGAVYQAELASQLRQNLGLTLEPDKVGFRIQGVPQELCREFSKRRRQIERALREKGHQGAVAAKVAALDTRPKKDHVSREQLFNQWRRVGESYGWSTEQAEKLHQKAPRHGAEHRPLAWPQSGQTTAIERSSQAKARNAARDEKQAGRKGPPDEPGSEQTRANERQDAREGSSHQEQQSSNGSQTHAKRTKKRRRARQPVSKASQSRRSFVRWEWDLMFPKVPNSSLVSGWKAPRIVIGQRTIPWRWDRILWSKSRVFGVRVQEKRPFPHSPAWSRFKNWRVPTIVFGDPTRPKYWDRILWKKELIVGELRLQQRKLFPRAPKWSPLREIKVPALRLAPKSPAPAPTHSSQQQSQQRSH